MNSHRLTRFRWEFIRWGGTACCAGRVQPTALSWQFFNQCSAQRRLGPRSPPPRAAADARRWAALSMWCSPLLLPHRSIANLQSSFYNTRTRKLSTPRKEKLVPQHLQFGWGLPPGSNFPILRIPEMSRDAFLAELDRQLYCSENRTSLSCR
jgi:hypothetical protein